LHNSRFGVGKVIVSPRERLEGPMENCLIGVAYHKDVPQLITIFLDYP